MTPSEVVDRDPAHVLRAGAEHAAEAGLEGQQHLPEGAARGAQDDADARVDDADAGLRAPAPPPPPTRPTGGRGSRPPGASVSVTHASPRFP